MFYQMERPLEKRDSWALGIILLYLFTSPFDEPLPWQQTENAEQVRNLLGPRAVNACLAKAYPIIRANHPAKGEAICALISKMVRVDPNERISITDARKEYREKIQGIPA